MVAPEIKPEIKINEDILNRIFFITERIVAFDGLADVFEHIVKTAVQLTRAEAATIRVFDIDSGKLEIVKGWGLSNGFLSQPPIALGEGITGMVVLEEKPFSTVNVTKVGRCVHKELAKLEGIKAVMSVPLKTRECAIGCITVYRKKAEAFTEHDMLLLNIFAAQASETVEKARAIGELKNQAIYDSLTGLYNKKFLLQVFETEIKLSLRHGYETGIMFLDIDDFKKFNDTNGHLFGDKLLSDFAGVLKGHSRKTDIAGRFGGEEFIIIAPHTGKNGALRVANKLREVVSKHKFTGRNKDVRITFSAGISSFPEDGTDSIELLKKADDAMYVSKKAGKNCVTKWTNKI
ncbi:MAG: sensor domain-containing diguanylate cyclase [Nitrospinae bacterium]|nr:sensor domain-containing diguanylate cyclase [Nitrospinota bacterium]